MYRVAQSLQLLFMQVCPVCAAKVEGDIVEHITTKHSDILKISFFLYICSHAFLHAQSTFLQFLTLFLFYFPSYYSISSSYGLLWPWTVNSLTWDYWQQKLNLRKNDSYSSFSSSRTEFGSVQSAVPSSNGPPDPFLSFIWNAPAAYESEKGQSTSPSASDIAERTPDEALSERYYTLHCLENLCMLHLQCCLKSVVILLCFLSKQFAQPRLLSFLFLFWRCNEVKFSSKRWLTHLTLTNALYKHRGNKPGITCVLSTCRTIYTDFLDLL